METISDTAATYAGLLADHFDNTARWRHWKATEFPDDHRNVRCANALTAAAGYVRSLGRPEDRRGVQLLLELDDELRSWALYRDTSPEVVLGTAGPSAVSRFFFDNGSREPTTRDFESLIVSAFDDTLEEWREAIANSNSNDQPPASLVRFFDEHGVRLWDEADDE